MSSKYELCTSLLKWLQTFHLEGLEDRYRTLDDITDGVAMAHALHQIAPEWFSKNCLAKIKTDVGDNWRLKVSNLKKIIDWVTDYYQEYVNPSINFVKPDAVRIGEHRDPAEMVKLLQLILGCAVNCMRKQEYIKQIMEMEESVQNVIMQSIQELDNLFGSSPMSFTSSLNTGGGGGGVGANLQLDQIVAELQRTKEERDELSHKYSELDLQLNVLQEEKNVILEEKKRLEDQLHELATGADPVKDTIKRKQINDRLELETLIDDYRLKFELQERELNELRSKYESAQVLANEARHLKDELDILRENAEKADKLETTVQSYKKKLEELSELKREMKQLEDKNLAYVRQTLELEEEVKKANKWKTQAERYKKDLADLRIELNEKTNKLDRMEIENMKALEKLNAIQKERERLIIERDSLKEANEELLCNKLQMKEDASDLAVVEGKSNTVSDSMMSKMELKRELIKLQHENRLLRQAESEKLPPLQTMYDDLSQQHKQLQIIYRQANQKILQLEAELKESGEGKSSDGANVAASAVKDLQNQLHVEKALRASECAEKDRLALELSNVKSILFEALSAKEQEYEELEDRYRKCLDKARSVAKCLDFPEIQAIGKELHITRNKVTDKDHILEEVEKQLKQDRLIKDTEEKLLASAFYNMAQKKQLESMDQRLINTNTAGGNLPFLARQRQSAVRRIPVPAAYNSK